MGREEVDEPLGTSRGPEWRAVHEDFLPYERLLAVLQYILEQNYEFILAIEVPEKRPNAGSVRR
jgi:hypothetical protein